MSPKMRISLPKLTVKRHALFVDVGLNAVNAAFLNSKSAGSTVHGLYQ